MIKNNFKLKSFSQITESYKYLFFDCDGVLWKGGQAFQEAFVKLNQLHENGKQLFFISNNCVRDRATIQQRLIDHDYKNAQLDQIYLSSSSLAQYIKNEFQQVKKVYCIGRDGLKSELKQAGIEVLDSNIHNDLTTDHDQFRKLENPSDIQAVVVGFDNQFNFYKMSYASFLIQNGAHFFVTESTSYNRLGKNKNIPAAGSIAESIRYSTKKDYFIVSKPNDIVLQQLQQKYNFDKKECLMIGDKIDTDIEMARRFGIDSCFVLSGEDTLEQAENLNQIEIFNQYFQNNNFYISEKVN